MQNVTSCVLHVLYVRHICNLQSICFKADWDWWLCLCEKNHPAEIYPTTLHVEYSRLFSGSICIIWICCVEASTIEPLLNSCCWPVGWQNRKLNIVASPRFSFPYHGTPKSFGDCPASLLTFERCPRGAVSEGCITLVAGQKWWRFFLIFFNGAKELSDKDPLKKCTESLL